MTMDPALFRTSRILTVAILAGGLSALGGCTAGWHRVSVPPDTAFEKRQQVQVWQGSHARIVHAVRFTSDSLIGVPFQLPPSCDTCAVAIPRDQIDSLRLGNQEAVGLTTVALPFAALIIFLYLGLRGLGGS